MDVTRDNFVSVFPHIDTSIKECDFISFDGEFTGLHGKLRANYFDRPDERYNCIRDAASTFSVIQLGISCFKKESSDRYTCSSFNFFVFPHKITGVHHNFDRDLSFNASTISFLVENGFDFNVLFTKGISYCRLDEKDAIIKSLEKESDAISIPDEEKTFINDVTEQVDAFIEKQDHGEPLTLAPCTSFQRKLIYSVLGNKPYSDKIQLSLKKGEGSVRSLLVTLTDGEKKNEERDRLLKQSIGISLVIQQISESKKPIVGHNCFIDLAFITNQFISPLPVLYKDFKEMVHIFFPNVYDTKYLASTAGINGYVEDSALIKMYNRIKEEPFAPIHVERVSCDSISGSGDSSVTSTHDQEKLHQAGFDSYITGYSFIALSDLIGRVNSSSSTRESTTSVRSQLFNSHVLALRNLMSLSYSHDYCYFDFNTPGNDPETDRKNVFYVTFPTNWKTKDLQDVFAPARIRTGWIDSTSAFVGVFDQTQTTHSISTCNSACNSWSIISYKEYRKRQSDTNGSNITPSHLTESSNCLIESSSHTTLQNGSQSSNLSDPAEVKVTDKYKMQIYNPKNDKRKSPQVDASPVPKKAKKVGFPDDSNDWFD